MGWNSSVVLVAGKTIKQVEKALPDVFVVTDRVVGWEDASSFTRDPGGALGEISGWVALWSPNVNLVTFDEFLEAASRRGLAVVCLQCSVSTYHGFIVYENGRHRRTLIRELFKVVQDDGDPLPEEAGLTWDDDEDTVFEVVKRLTGVDVPAWETWEGVEFSVVELLV